MAELSYSIEKTGMSPELKKSLKARAHSLKPVVITGQSGLSDAVIKEIDLALTCHELIKVRINAADREERVAMSRSACEATSSTLIQSVGHVVTLYRKRPEKLGK